MCRAATSIGCDSSLATGLSELQGELDLGLGLVGLILQRTLPFFPSVTVRFFSFCKGVDQLTVHTANGRVLGPFGGTGGVAFDTGDWSRSN